MAFELGLVGLPNVGKSTLYNALTQAGALVANYPFTTIEPNVGVASVPDERLARIAEIIGPEEVVSATLRVVDIAGLVRGASAGEGLGNQFLSHIRAVDAIAMVVRCFESAEVAHVAAVLDPIDDIEIVEAELMLSDLGLVERQIERVADRAKAAPREHAAEIDALHSLADRLRRGRWLASEDLDTHERDQVARLDLLTTKALIYVANVGESDLPEGGPLAEQVRAHAARRQASCVVVCAQLEADLGVFTPEETAALLADVDLGGGGLRKLVQVGYAVLDYITFFTTTGGRQIRAWELQRGKTALDAAARVHSDMARGFVRAEVVSFDALDRAGSLARARDRGVLRLEGRDYLVEDGDIIHIRFTP
ncbi:MAG: redox-regulated ATPase YchF [Chloroflexi bacterium]|nr:redox-regulated ATPase YchF [Chloroflexota bacterium]